ncbi:MAG: hypothetical protein KDD55_05005 [Bdellovibrionales bacterium]|nr:hypothetical protein [Bdellovibrionales bacterium]
MRTLISASLLVAWHSGMAFAAPEASANLEGFALMQRANGANTWELSGNTVSTFRNARGQQSDPYYSTLDSTADVSLYAVEGVWEPTLPESLPEQLPAEGFGKLLIKAWLENDGVFQILSGALYTTLGLDQNDLADIETTNYSVEFDYPSEQLLLLMSFESEVTAPEVTYGFRYQGDQNVYTDVWDSLPALLGLLNQETPDSELDPPYTLEELIQYSMNPDSMDPARKAQLEADLKAISIGGQVGVQGGTKGFGISGSMSFGTNADVIVRHPELPPLIAATTANTVVETGGEAVKAAAGKVKDDGPGWLGAIGRWIGGVLTSYGEARSSGAIPYHVE